MQRLLWIFMLLGTGVVVADTSHPDWRKSGSDRNKLENVVRVIPGASTIMLQMGERYRNLYWAARLGKWQFAEYQLEEIEELVATLMITRPKRAATAKQFLQGALGKFPAAIESKNWSQFSVAFENMREQCMRCHVQNDHAYIVLPAQPGRSNSIVLD